MQSSRRVLFTQEFKRNIKNLAKKYRSIRADLTPYITQLENGELPGDQIPGIEQHVYKVRVSNQSAGKGKRGGFRMIYYLKLKDEIILLSMYSKTIKTDISIEEITQIIKNNS
jgi:mRNA-degrading endonuclease RelE of RelBE toxin-antitoxin system